jgi:hypothetical protein
VIHVDSVGLVTLRKTCRLCVVCEMLITHQHEMDRLIDGVVEDGVRSTTQEYLVLGTLETRTWRRGFSGSVTLEEMIDHGQSTAQETAAMVTSVSRLLKVL